MKESGLLFEDGKPVFGDLFVGRKAELDELTEYLGNYKTGQSFAVIGRRRIGKTSLLFEVKNRLDEIANVVVVYINLEEISPQTFREFLLQYSRKLNLQVARKVNNEHFQALSEFLFNRVKDVSLKVPKIPKLDLKYSGVEVSLNLEGKKIELNSSSIEQILWLAQEYAEKTKKKIVIMLDEFQYVQDLEGDSVERVLRAHFQKMRNVSVVVCGSQQSILREMLGNKNRPFFNFFRPMELKGLNFYDVDGFYSRVFRKAGHKISKEAIRAAFDLTLGNPFYLQLLGKEIILTRNYFGKKEITEKMVSESFANMFKRRIMALESELMKATDKEREILIVSSFLKIVKNEHYSLISKLADTTGNTIRYALRNLEEKGLMEKVVGGYVFEDIFFQRYLFMNYFLKKLTGLPFLLPKVKVGIKSDEFLRYLDEAQGLLG